MFLSFWLVFTPVCRPALSWLAGLEALKKNRSQRDSSFPSSIRETEVCFCPIASKPLRSSAGRGSPGSLGQFSSTKPSRVEHQKLEKEQEWDVKTGRNDLPCPSFSYSRTVIEELAAIREHYVTSKVTSHHRFTFPFLGKPTAHRSASSLHSQADFRPDRQK